MASIKHLKAVRALMRKEPDRKFTQNDIRVSCKMNYHAVLNVLDYLCEEKKICRILGKKGMRYRWSN